jgi:hypothetical protein
VFFRRSAFFLFAAMIVGVWSISALAEEGSARPMSPALAEDGSAIPASPAPAQDDSTVATSVAFLAAGSAAPQLELRDQHDVAARIDETVRLVVFTREMDAGDIVKEALASDGARLLAEAGAVSVADIEAMPALVTRMFALPAMRKRPYRLLLDRDGQATATWPAVEGQVTLLHLSAGHPRKIARVDYATSAEALRAVLVEAARTGR